MASVDSCKSKLRPLGRSNRSTNRRFDLFAPLVSQVAPLFFAPALSFPGVATWRRRYFQRISLILGVPLEKRRFSRLRLAGSNESYLRVNSCPNSLPKNDRLAVWLAGLNDPQSAVPRSADPRAAVHHEPHLYRESVRWSVRLVAFASAGSRSIGVVFALRCHKKRSTFRLHRLVRFVQYDGRMSRHRPACRS